MIIQLFPPLDVDISDGTTALTWTSDMKRKPRSVRVKNMLSGREET